MVFLISSVPTNGVIYRHDRNEETMPKMVSEVGQVAGNARAAIVPRTEPYGSALQSETNGHGGRQAK